MPKNTDNVIRLISAGGNLNVNCDGRKLEHILDIVCHMKLKGNTYTLQNLENHNTDDLLLVIQEIGGNKNITLEI